MTRPDMICSQCGSVLSAVTFTCVRGDYCIAPQQPQEARTELTPIGEQYIIPGCEKRHDKARKATQLGLWD